MHPAVVHIFAEGGELQTIQFGKDGMGRGINKDTIGVFVSKLNPSSYDYGTKGKGILYKMPIKGDAKHKYLGDLFNFTIIDDLFLGAFGSKTEDDVRSNAITVVPRKRRKRF